MTEILDGSAVSEIEARHKVAASAFQPYKEVSDSLADIPDLCATVKHLRAETERLKASETFWQAEALLNHFCSEHAKNTRQAGYYCTICAKPFVMSVPQGARPAKYKDLQTTNADLQSQLEQLRAENEVLGSEIKEKERGPWIKPVGCR